MRRIIITLLGLAISITALGYVGSQAGSASWKDPLSRNPEITAIVEPVPPAAIVLSVPGPLNLNPAPTSTLAPTLINSAPVAVDDTYSPAGRFVPIVIDAPGVLENDTDPDGDPLTAQLVKDATHGMLILQPNGGFKYYWSLGAAAADSFSYRVSDGSSTSNTATVFINMFPNVAPVAIDDFYTVSQGGRLEVPPFGVLNNDSDADYDHLFAHPYSFPLHGSLDFSRTGAFSYVPEPTFTGIDTFTYRADDGTAMRSDEATVTITVTALPTPTPTPTPSSIQCWAGSYSEGEHEISVDMAVTRTGDVSGTASVDFVTVDNAGLQPCSDVNGIASPRCDFIITSGRLHFAAGETLKIIYVPIIDDSYAEGNETFTLTLTNPTGATLGAPSLATITIHDNEQSDGVNPVDDIDFFIRQLYLDFLDREPDPKGLQDWHEVLANCPPGSTACDRIEVASAFFRSPEFQDRGYFAYRLYPTIGKIPFNSEFMSDLAKVSGFLTEEELEASKTAFVDDFMAKRDFQKKYGWTAKNPAAYVDLLLMTVGLPNHPARHSWIASLMKGAMSRGEVLRALVDSMEMYQKYYNQSFVVMSYFGYLRRTPDSHYLQWFQTLDQSGGAGYRALVNGFLNSTEYRQRFGP